MADIIFILLFGVLIGLLGFCLIFLLYFSSAIFVWPPSIPTDRRSRRAIIDQIKTRYQADARIKISDLGSGYGHLVRDLARNFKNAEITGIELLWLPYLAGKILCRRFPNVKIIKSNFMEHDLSAEDVIVFFLRSRHGLDQKLEKEFKGKLVLSNNFPLKNRNPDEVMTISADRRIYVYNS